MGGKKFKQKSLMRHYNNNFLGQELYFDVDFKMDSFDDSAQMTKRVIGWLTRSLAVRAIEDLTIVLCGKGFQGVIWYGWDISHAEPHQQTYQNILTGKAVRFHLFIFNDYTRRLRQNTLRS